MVKLYEIEDDILFLIKNNITEFYLEEFSSDFNKSLSEAFYLLSKFSEVENGKLKMIYETKCPHCKKRVEEYTDLSNVVIGDVCYCESCGEFTKDKMNTYIFFKIDNDWINAIKELEEKKAIKEKERILAKMKNESDIIKQLNRVLDSFENIPEGGLSIEGKIIRSQINTYLNSKKEVI